MDHSPRSEKCETRYSTPVPELDDHRFQLEPLPRVDGAADGTSQQQQQQGSVLSPVQDDWPHLHVNEPSFDTGTRYRDFEQAVIDDDSEGPGVERLGGRRMSVSPGAVRSIVRSGAPQEQAPRSAMSNASSKSSSPPNSVDAFAEPRRRERANTLESRAPTDLGIALHPTVSAGTNARRPTFSNGGAIRPDVSENLRPDMEEEGDVCFPTREEAGRTSVIDYEELEEFVALKKEAAQSSSDPNQRPASLSSESKQPQVFYDMPAQSQDGDVAKLVVDPSTPAQSSSDMLDNSKDNGKGFGGDTVDEKALYNLPQKESANRFSFFSSECESTIHAPELGDLVLPGEQFRDLFQLGPEGGVWWLDIVNPDKEELGAISRAFSIHPLTTEDISIQEAREKVEIFKQYYFVCFRSFYQMDKSSEHFMDPVHLYMVVFREGVLSFSFINNPHAANVRGRISKLRDYVSLSSDWICYAMIDDIVDSFGPIIQEVEKESEAIEDHVYVARVEDFSMFLPQIGGLRKKVMMLMRLLGGKADVIKGFAKRCNEQYSVTPRGDIGLYLGDIQDHVVTMMSNLGHFEKMLSRTHTNYLTQLNVNNIMIGNNVNRVLSKITLVGSILLPMHLISGLWGMNVDVPGQEEDGLRWFFGIVGVIGACVVVCLVLARRYKLV